MPKMLSRDTEFISSRIQSLETQHSSIFLQKTRLVILIRIILLKTVLLKNVGNFCPKMYHLKLFWNSRVNSWQTIVSAHKILFGTLFITKEGQSLKTEHLKRLCEEITPHLTFLTPFFHLAKFMVEIYFDHYWIYL